MSIGVRVPAGVFDLLFIDIGSEINERIVVRGKDWEEAAGKFSPCHFWEGAFEEINAIDKVVRALDYSTRPTDIGCNHRPTHIDRMISRKTAE